MRLKVSEGKTKYMILKVYKRQTTAELYITIKNYTFQKIHSIEQKFIGLIFRTSRSGSDVQYSCHHNSSRFTFPIFVDSWRFSVLHSLQSITPRIY